MIKEKSLKLLQELSDAKGAPGFEYEVADLLKAKAEGLGPVTQDKMYNVYVERQENLFSMEEAERRRAEKRVLVQLDAHMDEVAFMVSAIHPNGCLEGLPLGSWVNSNIPAHVFWVQTKSGDHVKALTSSKPPHFMDEAEKKAPLQMQDILFDPGTSSLEATEALGIEIGAPIVPDVNCEYNDRLDVLMGKAFDCRAGCAAIIDVLEEIKGESLELDVIAGFSTQEEVGTRGALVTANRIKPDLAIVFEGCPCDDTFTPAYQSQTKLHKGPMLRHVDARMITHPGFQRYALTLGEKHGIPIQRAVRFGGSTNGAPIHLSNRGVPSIVIGIPVRYIHTSYGLMSYFDYQAAVKLAIEILRDMTTDKFEAI